MDNDYVFARPLWLPLLFIALSATYQNVAVIITDKLSCPAVKYPAVLLKTVERSPLALAYHSARLSDGQQRHLLHHFHPQSVLGSVCSATCPSEQ